MPLWVGVGVAVEGFAATKIEPVSAGKAQKGSWDRSLQRRLVCYVRAAFVALTHTPCFGHQF
jgi:hypothetical protein